MLEQIGPVVLTVAFWCVTVMFNLAMCGAAMWIGRRIGRRLPGDAFWRLFGIALVPAWLCVVAAGLLLGVNMIGGIVFGVTRDDIGEWAGRLWWWAIPLFLVFGVAMGADDRARRAEREQADKRPRLRAVPPDEAMNAQHWHIASRRTGGVVDFPGRRRSTRRPRGTWPLSGHGCSRAQWRNGCESSGPKHPKGRTLQVAGWTWLSRLCPVRGRATLIE
jgi:hypothetical protein